MNLAVLIPCHRRTDLLRQAMAAVDDLPVLVVDDSPAGLDLAGVSSVRTSGEVGFARAVNLGLKALESAGHTHVLLLNDDARPVPGCVDALVAAWTEDDGAVAPVLVDPGGDLSSGFVVHRSGRIRVRSGGVMSATVVDAVSGAAVLIRSSERLDEGYRHGFEDLDLCRRMRARGLAVRTLPVRCDHVGGATIARSSRMAQRAAVAGHMRYLGGGWRGGIAVALGVGQVLREGADPGRLMGVLDGWRDHRRADHSAAGGATP